MPNPAAMGGKKPISARGAELRTRTTAALEQMGFQALATLAIHGKPSSTEQRLAAKVLRQELILSKLDHVSSFELKTARMLAALDVAGRSLDSDAKVRQQAKVDALALGKLQQKAMGGLWEGMRERVAAWVPHYSHGDAASVDWTRPSAARREAPSAAASPAQPPATETGVALRPQAERSRHRHGSFQAQAQAPRTKTEPKIPDFKLAADVPELGLKAGDSLSTARSTYAQLARDNHPDLNPGDAEKLQRFQVASSAWAALETDLDKDVQSYGFKSLADYTREFRRDQGERCKHPGPDRSA